MWFTKCDPKEPYDCEEQYLLEMPFTYMYLPTLVTTVVSERIPFLMFMPPSLTCS